MPFACIAQIVIDQSSLPDFGDTILYKTDRNPKIDISPIGENQTWNFSSLQSPYSDEIVFSSPQAQFDDVDMLVSQNGEPLFLLSWQLDDLMINGQYSRDNMNKSSPKASEFSTPALLRKGNLSFGDSFEEEYIQSTTYDQNEISFEVLNSLAEIPDAIRIVRETRVTHEVDSWGRLILPTFGHEVLRVKIDQTEEVTYVAIKDGLETQIVQNDFMDELIETQVNRNISYHYYADMSKLPLVIVDTDSRGNIMNTTFQLNKRMYTKAQPFDERVGLSVQPNPTIGPVRFDFYGYPPGKYEIHIFNSILKKLWSKSVTIDYNGVVDVDLSFLQKGTYVYGIDNASGERLLTKRILIINP